MGTYTNWSGFAPEFQAAMQEEIDYTQRGEFEKTVLLSAVAHDWSIADFIKISKSRGKMWKFLAALSDMSLQIQGLGMVWLMCQVVGDELNVATTRRSIQTLIRLEEHAKDHSHNPYILQVLDDARGDARAARAEVNAGYWRDIRNLKG